ncbi:hypothetical protein BSBS38_02669 [Bacillus subtilis]|nr:hypothetical protein BSBS38_02669 [Bacillus subtilis]
MKLLMSFVFGTLGALLMVSVRENFSFTVTLIVLVVVIIVAFILDEVWKRHKKREKKINVDVKSKFTFFAYLLFTLLLKIHFFDVSFDSYLHPYE